MEASACGIAMASGKDNVSKHYQNCMNSKFIVADFEYVEGLGRNPALLSDSGQFWESAKVARDASP